MVRTAIGECFQTSAIAAFATKGSEKKEIWIVLTSMWKVSYRSSSTVP